MSQPEPMERTAVQVKLRLLLVDDHPVVLDGYRLMLDSQPDLEVCSAAANEVDALAALAREHPDLVVIDLKMPGRGGLNLIKDLVVLHPQISHVLLYDRYSGFQ
jgi:DNA-binding NarL/FixJ family response regulator